MTPRFLRRRIRPMWIAALVSAGWANRHDLTRWARFAKRAASERRTRPLSDLLT